MAFIQVLKGLNPGQRFAIEGDLVILGRHPDCQIVLDVGAISRQHAQIIHDSGNFFVEDLKSRNGTYVNGRMIEGRALLHENDRLKICDLLFTFHLHNQETAAATLDTPAPPIVPVAPSKPLPVVLDEGNNSATVMSTLRVVESGALRVEIRPEAKLKAMLEITKNLATAVSLDEVLPKILDSLFKVFTQADRGFVLMMEEEGGMMVPKAVRYRRAGQEETIRVSKTIINKVLQQREAILSADAASDSRFDMSQSVADFRIRSMLCVPMFNSRGDALGVIQLDTQDQLQRFEQDDLDVLASVAAQAAFAIENAQLHASLFEQQMLQKELEFGHKVQQGFLPSSPPKLPGYQFFDFYQAAKGVGGDLYDYVPMDNDRLGVLLGDVSGKGVGAALLMAKISADSRYCLARTPEPRVAVDSINESFCAAGWEDRFVTFVLCVLNTKTHEVTIVNAGHMPPMLRRVDGTVVDVEDDTGLPLGVADGMTYSQFTMTLAPGESLTLFTDGISEAMNRNRDLYGLERLRRRVSESADGAAELGRVVLDDVRQFVGNTPQSDDMCVVCFGRSPS